MRKKNVKLIVVFTLIVLLAEILVACGSQPVDTTSTGEEEVVATIPERTQKGNYIETPLVDYSISGIPEFVSDISMCVDADKQYILPDGYLYSCREIPTFSITNYLYSATDEDGALYNECGYLDNARIRSVLTIATNEGSFVTGFIPVKAGDIIYFNGNCFDPDNVAAGALNTVFYDANKQVVEQVSMLSAEKGYFEILETNADGYVSSMKVSADLEKKGLAFIRFSLIGSGRDKVISINEALIPSGYIYEWVQGEKYIPSSWYDEIKTTIDTIQDLGIANDPSAIQFLFATDIHLDPYSTNSYTENIGKVCSIVMHECNIPFFVTGGDNSTQSSGFMPTDFAANMRDLLLQFTPIPQKNILLSVGNHDGATGQAYDHNGEKVYYRFQLNNEQRSEVFFSWQRESNEYKQFDSDGTYYFLDDAATKTRYIVLNSFWSQWEGNAEGYVPNIQHSFFATPLFGPQQLQWFAEKALDMPPDYSAIIVTHFAPVAKDFEVFKGIVDAFSNQTIYVGSYIGEEEWQTTHMSVNYTDANGEIIAVFQGHNHLNAFYDFFDKVPCINMTTTGAFWAVNDENAEERIKGTSSEFAVDIVLIDRTNRKIYLIRLGAGEDRVIDY